MKSKNLLISLTLLLVLVPLVVAKAEIFILGESIVLGETIKVEEYAAFPQINFFKPIYPIPPKAINVNVVSSDNQTIDYERFNEDGYLGLQNYLKEACSVDEEGYITYDGGFEFIFYENFEINESIDNQTGYTFLETKGGYCEDYWEIIPTKDYDLILINSSGIGLPLTYLLVSYELRKSPTSNVECNHQRFSNESVRYILPEGAWVWNSTESLHEEFIENKVSFIINYSSINESRVCFSYGTKSEWHDYNSKKNNIWGIYIGISLAVFIFFMTLIYIYYSKNRSHLLIHLLMWMIILVLWFLFIKPVALYFRIIPPFSSLYIALMKISLLAFLILYIISLVPLKLVYQRCPTCRRIVKRRGYRQHLKRVHD